MAQKTRAQIATEIATLFADNTSGAISEADLRQVAQDIADSAPNVKDDANLTAGVNDQTGTAYTLLAADAGKVVRMTNAAGIVLTVPVGLPDGFNCIVEQGGAGVVAIADDGTSVLHSRGGVFNTAGQFGQASIIKMTGDVFTIGGDLSA